MKTAILSDIHANIEALTAVLADVDTHKPDRIGCLGDVIGYGASPEECCELVRSRCDFCLMGNHDAAVTGAMDEAYYYQGARHAIRWTRSKLSDASYKWLYSLPFTHGDELTGYYHSAPIMPSGFFYVVQESEAQTHLQVFSSLRRISFIGHSHLTSVFSLTEKHVKDVDITKIKRTDEIKYIANVGSVGQPRDRDPRACWVMWDDEEFVATYYRVEYDFEKAANKIIAAGLDEKFARRLSLGV